MNLTLKKAYNFSFVLIFMTMSMPKYNLNSQSLILFGILWMISSSYSEKLSLFKANYKTILLLTSLYLFMLFGLTYTDNLQEGLQSLKSKLPFLIIPIFLFTNNVTVSKDSIYKIFSISTLTFGLFGLLKATLIYYLGMGSYFNYSELGIILNKHTTYYSLFCLASINYFLYNLIIKKKGTVFFNILSISLLLLLVYLLSTRIAVIGLIVICIIYVNYKFKKTKCRIIISSLFIFFLLSSLLFSSNFKKRFEDFNKNKITINKISEFEQRVIHWKSYLKSIEIRELLFGKGTGDGMQNVLKEYKKNNFEEGIKYNYNAHNQYIEFIASNGFIGLSLFIIILLSTIAYSIRVGDFQSIGLLILISLFSLTESLFERHSGIIFFAAFTSLIYYSNRIKLNEKK